MALRVENRRDRPIEVALRGRTIAFDIVVRRDTGEDVWRRLDGETIPAIVQLRVLEPGEVMTLRATWDQTTRSGTPAGPGEYRVQGLLLTDDPAPLATPPVTLRIDLPSERVHSQRS
jgi:hypothetical protein